jgi:sugar lactone lactonase YvrE
MMYLDAPPRLIETNVFSAMPEAFRRKGVRTGWTDANRPGQPTDCFIEGPSFDAEGNLYIVDIPFGRIFKIAPDGTWSLVTEYDGCAGPSCTNVAIGGANRDRLYVTESVTGTVLVADISVLDSSLREA